MTIYLVIFQGDGFPSYKILNAFKNKKDAIEFLESRIDSDGMTGCHIKEMELIE